MGSEIETTDVDAVEKLLQRLDQGDSQAMEKLVTLLYPELKRLARYHLAGERSGHTLNTTAIVHEAYLRLFAASPGWSGRKHFMRAAAKVMRHLLVDHARERSASKRGAGQSVLPLQENLQGAADIELAVLNLDDALKEIAAIDPHLEQLVEIRYFAGLSVKETADALDRPLRSIERDLQRARAWISDALENNRGWPD
ncbi:MAG TPA: ECF-type sigma factor [Xanthomonadales bacterium]|nr:ECF-type sigma factor [Xanthomonadales bacterium]